MILNQYNYHCPKCNNLLNKDNKVLLNLIRKNGEKARIFLNPKPHSYDVSCEPEISFYENEIVDFICPKCNINLTSAEYDKFIKIILRVTDGVLFDVFLSRVYGDHRTFVGLEDFKEEYGAKISAT